MCRRLRQVWSGGEVAIGDKVSGGSLIVLLARAVRPVAAASAAVHGEPVEPQPNSTPDGHCPSTCRDERGGGQGGCPPHLTPHLRTREFEATTAPVSVHIPTAAETMVNP